MERPCRSLPKQHCSRIPEAYFAFMHYAIRDLQNDEWMGG